MVEATPTARATARQAATGCRAGAALLALTAACTQAHAQPPAGQTTPDAYDRAFATAGEPVNLHYTARYKDRRGTHDLEVWRQGSERLRRSTDEAIDLYAERHGTDALRIEVLDHRRHIATTVSRDALYRVGHGVEWNALAHGLARPRTAYTVQPWTGTAPATADGCRWQRLQEGARITAVCWNARLHLPARIVDMASRRTVWTLLASDTAPIAPSVFTVRAPGYVQVDADRDIQAD